MKKIKAVQPYFYPRQLNFKNKPFEAWKVLGGGCAKAWYPRLMHNLMFKFDLPTLCHGEARLCFVQPVSLYFDTFFNVLCHEIIPFIWDCWPCYYNKMERWMKKHKVMVAIFTSKQEMEEMQKRCPNVKMIWCPEAVDTIKYKEGKELMDRCIDLLEFGRGLALNLNDREKSKKIPKINHVKTIGNGKFLYSEEQLYDAMANAKTTICLPRSMTHPQIAEGIETLTQRFWEAMLSRMVIVGHCPKELEELIGYNPVIELNTDKTDSTDKHNEEIVLDILEHIEDYQELVDRNRKTALMMGDWRLRVREIQEKLKSLGYTI